MEDALKGVFGTDRALLDWSGVAAGVFTTKVAVTATTTDTSSACVFANYGGEGSRPVNCGKSRCFLGPKDTYLGSVWTLMPSSMYNNSDYDSARCTSAAPSYFSPHILRNSQLGSFQDGGLKHNNPVNIAQWEARVIWPQSTVMDMVLSMGTGTSPSTVSSTCGWRGRCLARLYRCFMSSTSLDGENAWKGLQISCPKNKKPNTSA